MFCKKNGKEDTLVFMQNDKFCFSMLCQTFPKNVNCMGRVRQGHDTKITPGS